MSNNIDILKRIYSGNLKVEKPSYVIGVDTYDKRVNTYCLMRRRIDNSLEIILLKTIRNEKDFNTEVENLSKYFNADIIREAE